MLTAPLNALTLPFCLSLQWCGSSNANATGAPGLHALLSGSSNTSSALQEGCVVQGNAAAATAAQMLEQLRTFCAPQGACSQVECYMMLHFGGGVWSYSVKMLALFSATSASKVAALVGKSGATLAKSSAKYC